MPQNTSIPMLLVSGNPFTQKTLVNQLNSLLPDTISIMPFIIEDGISPKTGTYFAVFSSKEVCNDFMERNFDVVLDSFVAAERTMLNDNIDKILSLPRNQRILLVNDSKESTGESLAYLKKIGFDFLDLVPYYPGCTPPDPKIKIAITPGEIDEVPLGIDAVYNVGTRYFDFTTIVRILSYYGLLEEVMPSYADGYFSNLLDFARKLSNVVDEASQVMTTVRTDLIGSGYFAKYRFADIIGQSQELVNIKTVAKKIARTNLNVLIEGDNGTGKELFASAIHNASNRCRSPFVAINLSALPDQLVESELFGYDEGAFTGARKKGKIGLFQQASGGTIFLDEIGDISPKMQAKLLRVIQEREIMRVGGDRIIHIDVRIIAATNQNLLQMIEERSFRKDLYYRLKEGYLKLPPLVTRKEDILLLIEHWQRNRTIRTKVLDAEALHLLMAHDWPGNIRELLNLMKFVSAVSDHDRIAVSDLAFLRQKKHESKVFHAAENYMQLNVSVHQSINLDSASFSVLTTANELQREGILVGRTSISHRMKEKAVPLTEYKVRKCIQLLLNQNLLRAEAGRYGLSLMPQALELLESQK